MSDLLKATANAAGLSPAQKQVVDALSKSMTVHKQLNALPADLAQQQYQKLTPAQQEWQKQMYGTDDVPESHRSILGTATHYAGVVLKNTVGRGFQALDYLSDLPTRAFRTAAVMKDYNKNLLDAWSMAGRDGDALFQPDRIAAANAKYGVDRMIVAQRVAAGEKLSHIQATAQNAAQADIAAQWGQKQDNLMQDSLDAAHAAQYSPGRFIANTVLPAGLEGSGFLYKVISGLTDASFRVVTDPTLAAAKWYKSVQAANYGLRALFADTFGADGTGGQKLIAAFEDKKVRSLWDTAGKQLEILNSAKSAERPLQFAAEAAQARQILERLVPDIPTTAWDEFAKAGVRNADTMRDYMLNSYDAFQILMGQSVRYKPLLPAMTPGRAIRVKALTTGNKVMKWSKVENEVLDSVFASADDIMAEGDLQGVFDVIAGQSTKNNLAANRLSTNRLKYMIDRTMGKFTQMPFMDGQRFQIMGKNAPKEIYRLSVLGGIPRPYARVIAEIFDSSTEGRRIEMYKALRNSIANVKNVTKSKWAKQYLDDSLEFPVKYAADDAKVVIGNEVVKESYNPALFPDGKERALFPFQFATSVVTPNIKELQAFGAKDGVVGQILGYANHDAVTAGVSAWNLGTIGGPRMPMRSALEDFGVHLGIGEKSWNLPRARFAATQIRASREGATLGFINKIVKGPQLKHYTQRLADIEASQLDDEGKYIARNELVAEAIFESKTGKTFYDEAERKLMQRQIKYGNINHVMDSVTESVSNAYSGTGKLSRATRLSKQYDNSAVAELVVKGKGRVRRGRTFENLSPAASWENRLSWIDMIEKHSTDQVGRLIVAHLGPDKLSRVNAVESVKEYLSTAEGRAILDRYRSVNNLPNIGVDDIANRAYDAVWHLFSKKNGELNTDLLNLVRPEGRGSLKFHLEDLTLEKLPKLADDMPTMIAGPKYVAVGDNRNWLQTFSDWAWWKMSQANGMMSREPIAMDTLTQVRQDMVKTGYDDAVLHYYTKGITDPKLREKALEEAERRLASEAEDAAIRYTLAYVDNPNVQSQLAFTMKNFARYYRATEDFYRRITRAVRYSPESIAKASLTYEGISHSGFIQTDDQGEKYFVFPGLAPVYSAVQAGLKVLGVNTSFKIPMPVEFRAKLNMVTPSINPESMIPTFSGPVAAIPLNVFTKIVGNYNPQLGADITKLTMGSYSVDQPLVNALLPAHINRIYAALNKDDRDSQLASAQRKAMTYLAAAGLVPKPTIDENGVEQPPSAAAVRDFREQLRNATMSILGMRVILGFVGPASPQVDLKSDMARWVRENGEQSFKTTFWNIRNEVGSYEKAMEIWIAKYPNQIPFTVSESDGEVKGLITAIKPVGDWLNKYGDVYEKYPKASGFLVPQSGGPMSYDVYRTLQHNGISFKKNVGDFYRDITTSSDLKVYYANRDSYEQQLATAFDSYSKQQLKDQWDSWAKPFLAARPDVQAELSQGGERQVARAKMLDDMRSMLADKTVKASPKARAALNQMLALYDQYVQQKGLSNSYPGFGGINDAVKLGVKQQMEAIAASNANADAAYNRLFRPLIGD